MSKVSEFGNGSVHFKFERPLQFHCEDGSVAKFKAGFAHYTHEGENTEVSEFWLISERHGTVCVFSLSRAEWSDSVKNFNTLSEQIPFLGEYLKEAVWKR